MTATNVGNDVRVESLRVEHLLTPLGIGQMRPRLSWTTRTPVTGWTQAAYEIEVSDAPDGDVTQVPTGRVRVESPDSVLVPWPQAAAPLQSRERRTVRVRVWGSGDDEPSGWSEPVVVEAGLLTAEDWSAAAVSPAPELHGTPPGPAPLLRRSFTVRGPVARARLYASAFGAYEIELNGGRVGDEVLAPGWTSYSHRLRYQTHDVTSLLSPGDNAIGALLADGWYRGPLGFRGGVTELYGDRLALIAQLEITYADGTTDVVASDTTWRCAAGPITQSGLYAGERYDARREEAGWSSAGFDDTDWLPVDTVPLDPGRLVAPDGPPVRRTEVLPPVSVTRAGSGGHLLDFGQNISGRLRIRVRGDAGHTVRLRHAEVLENGELAVRPLRGADAIDEYTLAGRDEEVWEPRFTTHGFRYAHVEGWPGELRTSDVQAVVCHTDLRRTGWFNCSEPLLNKLHDNVVWSMRGNFLDIPTDCPQRDERLGWTGDIQVFAPTASFLYDCSGMLSSWLADLAIEQRENETVPHYVPWVPLGFDLRPAAAWGDAAVLVPWALYQRFGDVEILRSQYPSMTAWVDQIADLAGERHLWDSGFQFGDWLDPSAPPDRPAAAKTDRYLVATAYHAYSAQVLADVAAILGREDDHARYAALAAAVRDAFGDEYVTSNGRLVSDAQTGYALALQFDLLPKAEQRERAGRRLAELVAAEGHRIGTGFVGTPLVCDALSAGDDEDTAYLLLTQQECPSWLYPVTMGATTIWERWDSLLPDGSVNPGEMTSFNHYALGAVADWMHRTVAGLAPAAPGYRRLLVRPRPGGGLTHARAEHDTPYGRAAVGWQRTGGRLDLTVTVPPGTTATVQLPAPSFKPVEVGSGEHTFTCEFRDPSEDPTSTEP